MIDSKKVGEAATDHTVLAAVGATRTPRRDSAHSHGKTTLFH
jgi:hypothetical protein